MKRMLILVAVLLLPLSAMAGMAAFMNMDETNDQDLASVTGQTGVDIVINNMSQSIGSAGWEDDDGYGIPTSLAGSVVLGAITMSEIVMGTISIDAGTTAGGVSSISIQCTAGINQGTIDVGGIYLTDDVAALGTSDQNLGRLHLEDVNMAFDGIVISAH